MILHILFGQRKQRYEGEYAPEALVTWDEYCVDENPEGWETAVAEAKAKYGEEMSSMKIINVSCDGDKIVKLLNGTPTVKGEVEG